MALSEVFDASFEQVRLALSVCVFIVLYSTFFLVPCYSMTFDSTTYYTVLDDWNKGVAGNETEPPPMKPWLYSYLGFVTCAIWIQFYNFYNPSYALGGTLLTLISAGLAAVVTDQLVMHVEENCGQDIQNGEVDQRSSLGALPYIIMTVPAVNILLASYIPTKLFLT